MKEVFEEGENWSEIFGFIGCGEDGEGEKKRLIYFKFELMVSMVDLYEEV